MLLRRRSIIDDLPPAVAFTKSQSVDIRRKNSLANNAISSDNTAQSSASFSNSFPPGVKLGVLADVILSNR